MNIQDYVALFPGIAAVITGVLAFIVTIVPPQSMKSKIWWLIAFVALAILAIYTTFWQQSILNQRERILSIQDSSRQKKEADRDIAFSYMSGQLNSLLKLSSHSESPQDLRRQLTSELASFSKKISKDFTTKQTVSKSDVQPLKEKCLILAYKLKDVFSAREKAQSITPSRVLEMERRDYAAKNAYIYAEDFALQVAVVHDALVSEGLTDPIFDSIYKQPTTAYGIIDLANRIEVLAKRLN